jgi:hypothetical protein
VALDGGDQRLEWQPAEEAKAAAPHRGVNIAQTEGIGVGPSAEGAACAGDDSQEQAFIAVQEVHGRTDLGGGFVIDSIALASGRLLVTIGMWPWRCVRTRSFWWAMSVTAPPQWRAPPGQM